MRFPDWIVKRHIDSDGPSLFADLIEKEYGTREEELKWGMDRKLSWGEMTALGLYPGHDRKELCRDDPGECHGMTFGLTPRMPE